MFRAFPIAIAASLVLLPALAGQGASASEHDQLVAKHAAAYGVPEALVRRVIHIESKGNPRVVSKGNYGLMQIRLGTAKAMGYSGDAEGLLDADTNMTYAVRYLAGAYRAAGGNSEQAIRNYQRGYYDRAKAQGFSPYSPIVATQQAAAPDPAMVKEVEQRREVADQQRQAADQQRAAAEQLRQAALQSRIEQQKSAEAARVAQREAMLLERAERKSAAEQQRSAQRQAALQQQADREQARQQQRIDREQAKERRIEQPEQPSAQSVPTAAPVAAARPARSAAAPAQAWYNPMRYFNHPTHKTNPYKPAER